MQVVHNRNQPLWVVGVKNEKNKFPGCNVHAATPVLLSDAVSEAIEVYSLFL